MTLSRAISEAVIDAKILAGGGGGATGGAASIRLTNATPLVEYNPIYSITNGDVDIAVNLGVATGVTYPFAIPVGITDVTLSGTFVIEIDHGDLTGTEHSLAFAATIVRGGIHNRQVVSYTLYRVNPSNALPEITTHSFADIHLAVVAGDEITVSIEVSSGSEVTVDGADVFLKTL